MPQFTCTCRKRGRGPYKGWKGRRRRRSKKKGFFGLGIIPI